jgi:hypothetical protein
MRPALEGPAISGVLGSGLGNLQPEVLPPAFRLTPPLPDLRARVFVSCGQRSYRRSPAPLQELAAARAVGRALSRLGFLPYIATDKQSLRGIVENVLFELHRSEYLVFVDFIRDEVKDPSKPSERFRGSLFSHQELAIATDRGLEMLGFQEEGLDSRDGFVGYIQGNVYSFRPAERGRLPELVSRQIRRRLRAGEWATRWRRQLRIEAVRGFTGPVLDGLLQRQTHWFHLSLHNDHRTRHAYNAAVFATKIRRFPVGRWKELPPIPLKFDYLTPATNLVPAMESRKLAAFRATVPRPVVGLIAYNPFLVDYPRIADEFALPGVARYVLRVEAIAEGFDRIRRDFLIRIGANVKGCTLRPMGPSISIGPGS